ncbi:MAG: hypothetical protein JWM08_2352, partial [Candidatus Angelobacter sp.]|nr:hypothetical protein [Candidatus Angelobacter sp.]
MNDGKLKDQVSRRGFLEYSSAALA